MGKLSALFNILKSNWQLAAWAAGVAFVIGIGAGWFISSAVDDFFKIRAERSAVKEAVDARNAAEARAVALEKELAKLKSASRIRNQKREKEIVQNRIYSDCTVPADGLRLRREAVEAGQAR